MDIERIFQRIQKYGGLTATVAVLSASGATLASCLSFACAFSRSSVTCQQNNIGVSGKIETLTIYLVYIKENTPRAAHGMTTSCHSMQSNARIRTRSSPPSQSTERVVYNTTPRDMGRQQQLETFEHSNMSQISQTIWQ